MKTTFRRNLIAVAVASTIGLFAPYSMALDDTRGQLKGHVETNQTDLANAEITLIHEGKGITRTVTSNDSGIFIATGLPAGRYTLQVSKDGYDKFERKGYLIIAGANNNAVNVELFNQQPTERIAVTASRMAMIDTASNTQTLDITAEEINMLPVSRNINAISLLAPGSVKGDPALGEAVSFGGASVGENGYYLNGINITEFRNGNGPVNIPWELVNQSSTLTSGVGSEYGRHIGGVVNLTSKSGNNDLQFGARFDYIPQRYYRNSPDIIGKAVGDGSPILIQNNREDSLTRREINLWASGAIIEDKLFFYGLYNPINRDRNSAEPGFDTSYLAREDTADFWFGKVDYFITENHSIEFQALNNENERESTTFGYHYLAAPGERFDPANEFKSTIKTGGDLWSISYNGHLTDEVSVTARYGVISQDEIVLPGTPGLYTTLDKRQNGEGERIGPTAGDETSIGKDEKTVWRIDVDWIVGDHTLRFGYDSDELEVDQVTIPNGSGSLDIFGVGNDRGVYSIFRAGANDINGFAEGQDYVERRIFNQSGVSEMKANAFYVQDSWQLTDNVLLNLGGRWSSFENTTVAGEVYVKEDNLFAPRLGANWDVFGDGESKLSLFYGRFYMGVAANSNIRLGGSEAFIYQYYDFEGLDTTTGLVTLGELQGTSIVQDGTVSPGNTLTALNLDAMYADEISLAYEQQLNDDWRAGVRLIRRELKSAIEDAGIDVNRDGFGVLSAGHITELPFVFINPGKDVTLLVANADGVLTPQTYSAQEIGLPEVERKYNAMELTFEGRVNSKLRLQGSYTWSENTGNTEGMMRSDNGQDDAGLTTSFDLASLVDHGNGLLPNDRKHNFKLFGAYQLTDNFSMGFNLWAISGKPINSFGLHPNEVDSCGLTQPDRVCIAAIYGASSFYTAGVAKPRGSQGRTPWLYGVDLSANYIVDLGQYGEVKLKVAVENAFDFDKLTTVDEKGETDIGLINPNWGSATNYQTPRHFTFTASYQF